MKKKKKKNDVKQIIYLAIQELFGIKNNKKIKNKKCMESSQLFAKFMVSIWKSLITFLNKRKMNRLRLCLVPRKYQGKKKNAKKNDFLMFDFTIKFFKEN